MEEAKEPRREKRGAAQTVLNVLGVILCVIFVPIIILNVVMIVKSYTDSDQIPSVFGYAPIIVLSGSMSPEFETGDMILVKRTTDPYSLQVGDVITYLEEESAVTHRIIEVQTGGTVPRFVTQGDANDTQDTSPVQGDQVWGKYTGIHIPRLGEFAIFMQSTVGMVVFIVGPLLLIVLWDVLRRFLASRKSGNEAEKLRQEQAAMAEELERLRAQVGQTAEQQPGGEDQAP